MDLLLWRHAQSQEAAPGLNDLARRLTSKGEKQALRMGRWLDRQLPDSTRILVSPAHRALQTAQALGRQFKVCEQLAPDQTAQSLMEISDWPHARGVVLLVGHQPALGQLIGQLLAWQSPEVAVKKGAVWWLHYRRDQPQASTQLLTVQSPEFL